MVDRVYLCCNGRCFACGYPLNFLEGKRNPMVRYQEREIKEIKGREKDGEAAGIKYIRNMEKQDGTYRNIKGCLKRGKKGKDNK